ncbi:Disease resistance protein RPP13 [Vitis vinifera]|uniref:Disease resistance protein RPP13 n=1 Tax=Vitis vinifera TaxID=29760 RepID=A0A438H9Z2_VITVI|nr:Disease resistance protein RPP13 [Vitis vinifera]
MDDVWSIEAWSSLRSYLPESRNGSKVLMTTRNKEIAAQANPHEVVGHTDSQALVYELRIMDGNESWELFLKKTFGARDSTPVSLSKALEELGRKIVAKCKGLPLADCGVRRLIVDEREDRTIMGESACKYRLASKSRPGVMFGILALSYNDLPYYLKSCFLYCGIFPEDSEIKASKLIHLWIAEGFVQRRGKEKLEDIAEDFLYELIHRSMVQVARKKANGRVMSCRIHDLLRDLAISEARDANFLRDMEFYKTKTLLNRVWIEVAADIVEEKTLIPDSCLSHATPISIKCSYKERWTGYQSKLNSTLQPRQTDFEQLRAKG